MKFKELIDSDKDYIKSIYLSKELSWDDRMNKLMSRFDKCERTIRRWLVKLGFKEKVDVEIESEQYAKAKEKTHDKSKKRFLVTWCQNATLVHKGFWGNLLAYSKFIDAQILVVPGRYHNMTAMDSKEKYDSQEWWDQNVVEYLTLNRHNLNKNLCVLGNIPIQPTATNPLNSLECLTLGESGIVGHPRVHLKTLPVLDPTKPKFLMSTGACSVKNFAQNKSAMIAEFHHTLGAVIVEIKNDDVFFFRQITATEKGDFHDLFFSVVNGVVENVNTVEGLIMGDIHVAEVDNEIVDKTLNDLCVKLKPNFLVAHDIMDSKSISHHTLSDPFKLHQQEMDGSNSLSKEIDDMLNWLEQIKDYNVVIVKSNHDTHIDKWLRETTLTKMSTLKNAIPYMEYAAITLKGDAPNGIVPYLINKRFPKFKCLDDNSSFKIKGFEVGQHGHNGFSGSRASISQYRRLNTKIITGHSHQAFRLDGALSVATSTHLRLSYTKGASAWSNCHIIINKLGKAQHIFMLKNKDGIAEYTTLG